MTLTSNPHIKLYGAGSMPGGLGLPTPQAAQYGYRINFPVFGSGLSISTMVTPVPEQGLTMGSLLEDPRGIMHISSQW